MILWLLEHEHDIYYDSTTVTPIAVFSDPADAMIYADNEYEYFTYRKIEYVWQWDQAGQELARLVQISSGESSCIRIRGIELDPIE